jgi:hypothetical protein
MGCDCTKVDLTLITANPTVEVGQAFDVHLSATSQGGKPSVVGSLGVVIQCPPSELRFVACKPSIVGGMGTEFYQAPWHDLVEGELHINVFYGMSGLPPVPAASSGSVLSLATLTFVAKTVELPDGPVSIAVVPIADWGRSRHKTQAPHAHNFGSILGELGSVEIELVQAKPPSPYPLLGMTRDRLIEVLSDDATPMDAELFARVDRMLTEGE